MGKESATGQQDCAQFLGELQGSHRVKFKGGAYAIVLGVQTAAGKKKEAAVSGFAPLCGKKGIASVWMI